jgi:hypothetical protein
MNGKAGQGAASAVAAWVWVCCEWAAAISLGALARKPIDVDRLELVSQAAEQGLGQVFMAQQDTPLVVLEVGGDKGGLAAVGFFHLNDKTRHVDGKILLVLAAQVWTEGFVYGRATTSSLPLFSLPRPSEEDVQR